MWAKAEHCTPSIKGKDYIIVVISIAYGQTIHLKFLTMYKIKFKKYTIKYKNTLKQDNEFSEPLI